jgi:DNA-binding HxlR family transcriptional regulator
MESAGRLSEQQKAILRWLLKAVRTLEDRNDSIGRLVLRAGIEWRPRVDDKERENCLRASLCRAIERLERRRLIKRVYGPTHRRTIALKLTGKGRRVAEIVSG